MLALFFMGITCFNPISFGQLTLTDEDFEEINLIPLKVSGEDRINANDFNSILQVLKNFKIKKEVIGNKFVNGTVTTNAVYMIGNVGIGTETPATKLHVVGEVRADIFYDSNNTAYYVNPASTSYLNDVRANIFYDKGNTSYYVNPAGTSKLSALTVVQPATVATPTSASHAATKAYVDSAAGGGASAIDDLSDGKTDSYSVFLGSGAGTTDGGSYNTAVGIDALYFNTGNYNIANGYRSLFYNTTGNNNTANGYQALFKNTTGYSNVANGASALYNNSTGYQNVANGYNALYFNTTGYSNVANGFRALYKNTTGDYNVANGYHSLYINTTGNNNVAYGGYSLYINSTGNNNVANGYRALYMNSAGSSNVAIGYMAGYSETGSNKLYIENSSSSSPLIGGDFLADTVKINGALTVTGDVNANSFVYSSDRRLKENIKTVENALSKTRKLEGVSFHWKKNGKKSLGLIAQDVEKILPELVSTNNEDGLKSVEYGNIVALLIESIKDQQNQIDESKREISELKNLIFHYEKN